MNNKKYWEQRISRVMRDIYNAQEKKNITLLQGYKKALKDVKLEIADLYIRMGDNPSLSEGYKYNRLKKVEKQIENIIKDLGNIEQKFFDESLENNYIEASNRVIKEFEKHIGINFNKVDRATIDKVLSYPWSGADYSSRIWNNKDKLINELNETLTRGLVQGASLVTLSKEIKSKMDSGAYESLRLIRTEAAHIVNTACIDRYTKSEMVETVMWWASEDERTCSICGALHGQEFTLGKETMNPNHPNCRCCWIPII
ncbi:minor capsid protein [uncultured Clostridium sp.]|uniref:minor capsid protein n=1 Tax=uncultured Clostridium sp. TaxID=59620 RepID=UPI0028E7D32A|nr:minor capsid protein [uncultured Clostridium sp.]